MTTHMATLHLVIPHDCCDYDTHYRCPTSYMWMYGFEGPIQKVHPLHIIILVSDEESLPCICAYHRPSLSIYDPARIHDSPTFDSLWDMLQYYNTSGRGTLKRHAAAITFTIRDYLWQRELFTREVLMALPPLIDVLVDIILSYGPSVMTVKSKVDSVSETEKC